MHRGLIHRGLTRRGTNPPVGGPCNGAPISVRDQLRVQALVTLTSLGLSAGMALLIRAAVGLAGA